MCIYERPGAQPGVIRIEKSHLAINEKVADDGVIFLWHFSKVSINDLFYSGEQTQESMITFLANQFKPVDIKVAFAALIGKVGGSALTAFYPLPSQRAKLLESCLELVFNEKSMLVDTIKKPFR